MNHCGMGEGTLFQDTGYGLYHLSSSPPFHSTAAPPHTHRLQKNRTRAERNQNLQKWAGLSTRKLFLIGHGPIEVFF